MGCLANLNVISAPIADAIGRRSAAERASASIGDARAARFYRRCPVDMAILTPNDPNGFRVAGQLEPQDSLTPAAKR
jgi:hypothetical protein